jgi:hypothetical protein
MDKKYLLLIPVLALAFILVYEIHFDQPLPIHLDEWAHIGNVAEIHEQGPSRLGIESGFDIILLFISFFANLIEIYKFLPAINVVLISLVLFYFMRKKFNFWVGFLSIIFLASLRSNINILGIRFFVPVIAAIVFDYLCLFYLEESVKEKNPKKIFLSVLFLFLIAFIHQSSFLVIFLVVLVYLCFNYEFVVKNKYYFLPFTLLIFPTILAFRSLTSNFVFLGDFFKSLIWGPLYQAQINFNPFLFFGILSSMFAVIGYYIAYRKKTLLLFRIYVIIPLINLFIFPFTNFTIFSSYQRYIYHFMIAAVPLSAVGFYYSIMFVKDYLKKFGKVFSCVIVGLLVAVSIFVIFYGYNKTIPGADISYTLTEDEYFALKTLENYPSGDVLTPMRMGITVRAILKDSKSYTTSFYVGRKEKMDQFYDGNCSTKKDIIDKKELDSFMYVYSKTLIECNFTEEIYQAGNNFIYRLNIT